MSFKAVKLLHLLPQYWINYS